MSKKNSPFLSDEFLDELAKEINQQNGDYSNEQDVKSIDHIASLN